MKLNFQVAEQWDELNEYQLSQISGLLFQKKLEEKELQYRLIFYLFVKKNTLRNYFKFRKLINRVSINELISYTEFIIKNVRRTVFPESIKIKGKKFYSPSPRLSNLTIEEFATADLFFYQWKTKNSLVDLERLITVLYREKSNTEIIGDIRKPFSKLDLPRRGNYIPYLDLNTKLAIGLTYLSCRNLIIKKYPVLFPPAKNNTENKKYQSFYPALLSTCLGEIQPLGNFNEAKNTLIDNFFSIVTENILLYREREKAAKK